MTFERQVVAYKRYLLDFYEAQEETVQRKIEWTLNLIRITRQVPKKYFQHMETIKGLYEIRVEVGNNIFRIFSFFDTGNLIVLANGKRGAGKREEWEQEFEAFRLGILLEEARLKLGMTQEQLAEKCGTNKSYISRIENNASDIRLSTLMKIIQTGLGGHLKLTLQL